MQDLYDRKALMQSETGVRIEVLHPVLTTSLPRRFKGLGDRILEWCDIKNEVYRGQAGFQFSLNSTDEGQRRAMFQNESISLDEFSEIAKDMPAPISRKYCLNFAYSTDFVIDADYLLRLFDPDKFMCKITPIHNNASSMAAGIKTIGGYESWEPYRKPEEALKAAGFDTLVFVPSTDEEHGLVTCGNLVLGGGKVTSEDIIRIKGIEHRRLEAAE